SSHGNFVGSFSSNDLISLPSTTIVSALASTLYGKRPCAVSYFNKYAKSSLSVKSLIATTSKFEFVSKIRRNDKRPIRPKPLIATFTDINDYLLRKSNCFLF